MLSIRLTRTGKAHDPHYRIVVQEKRSKLNGKAIDTIGHYHPAHSAKLLVIDKEKAIMWMSRGAQASDTVTNLFVKDGILDQSKKVHNFFTPVKKDEPVVETPKVEVKEEVVAAEEVEVPAEVVAETPIEEVAEVVPEVEEVAKPEDVVEVATVTKEAPAEK